MRFCTFFVNLHCVSKRCKIEIMLSKKNNIWLPIIILLLFIAAFAMQSAAQDISAVNGMRRFDAGDYKEAEKIFVVLLQEDPANPMLNYYYGASRTENRNFSENDLRRLLQVEKSITPDRLHYYLGMQYHARGEWEEAVRYYNLFRLSVPEKEQQSFGLSEKIQQCYDHVNPYEGIMQTQAQEPESFQKEESQPENILASSEEIFIENELSPPVETDAGTKEIPGSTDESAIAMPESEEIPSPENDSLQTETSAENAALFVDLPVEQAGLPDIPGLPVEARKTVLPPGDPIDFRINSDIIYLFDSQFKTDEGKELFEQGTLLRRTLNEKTEELDQSRKAYRNTGAPDERKTLAEKIVSLETDTYTMQDGVNTLFASARNRENEYWENAGEQETYNFKLEQDKILAIIEAEKEETEQEYQQQNISPENIPESFFEIYEQKPATQSGQKPENLVYKIQIGAYSRGVPAHRQRLFNKLSLIRKIENYTDEKGVVVYTTGSLTTLEDAEKMHSQVKQEGIQDAVIAPYFNGKRIPLEQAKQIEAGK